MSGDGAAAAVVNKEGSGVRRRGCGRVSVIDDDPSSSRVESGHL